MWYAAVCLQQLRGLYQALEMSVKKNVNGLAKVYIGKLVNYLTYIDMIGILSLEM